MRWHDLPANNIVVTPASPTGKICRMAILAYCALSAGPRAVGRACGTIFRVRREVVPTPAQRRL
jgi:hypothetical protein